MSQNWRVGFDTAFGTSIGWALARPRLRRLAEESSGHLDEGRKAGDPRWRFVPGVAGQPCFWGWASLLSHWPCWRLLATASGRSSLGNAAFIAGGALAVVLTDRRLLVFRWSGMFMGHIRDPPSCLLRPRFRLPGRRGSHTAAAETGLSHATPGNLAKSVSVETTVRPCSTASAARCASGTRFPAGRHARTIPPSTS